MNYNRMSDEQLDAAANRAAALQNVHIESVATGIRVGIADERIVGECYHWIAPEYYWEQRYRATQGIRGALRNLWRQLF